MIPAGWLVPEWNLKSCFWHPQVTQSIAPTPCPVPRAPLGSAGGRLVPPMLFHSPVAPLMETVRGTQHSQLLTLGFLGNSTVQTTLATHLVIGRALQTVDQGICGQTRRVHQRVGGGDEGTEQRAAVLRVSLAGLPAPTTLPCLPLTHCVTLDTLSLSLGLSFSIC